jgi:hypothetical protein
MGDGITEKKEELLSERFENNKKELTLFHKNTEDYVYE